ncbi:MAG: hypothetical protein RSG53_09870 [Oscillospiraceae bacterium]
MADYKKMYHTLFNKITDIIDELQVVQQQTEEMFIAQEEQIIKVNAIKNKETDSDTSVRNK